MIALLPLVSVLPFLPPAQGGDSLARLVPRDTVLLVQVPSLAQVASAAQRTMSAFDPESKEPLDIASLLSNFDVPGDKQEIDGARPMGVCLVLAREPGAMPQPVFLVPARSPEAYARSLAGPDTSNTTLIDGGYVLVAPAGGKIERSGTPEAIALGLPAGDLVARFDLARLIEQFRPMIDPMLDQVEAQADAVSAEAAGGIDPAPVMESYFEGVRDFLDSAETLDVALRLQGERLELGLDFVSREGSVLAGFGSTEKTDVPLLARYLDPQASFSVLAGMDMVALTTRFRPFYDTMPEMYPEPMRQGVRDMLSHLDEFSAQLGSAISADGDFGPGGMRFTYVMRARDAAKLLAVYDAMLRKLPGLGIEAPTQVLVDNVPLTRWRMRLDPSAFAPAGAAQDPAQLEAMTSMMRALYGEDGLVVHIATRGDVVLMVLGGDEAYLRSALKRSAGAGPSAPAWLQDALGEVASLNPCFVLRYDLGKLMQGIQGMASALGAGDASEMPVPQFSIVAWGGVEGRTWHANVACQLGEVATAMHTLMEERLGRARSAKALADLELIRAALNEFAINNAGRIPEVLDVLVVKDANGEAYLMGESPLIDPWGRAYLYDAPSPGQPQPRIRTLGRDGKPGGLGEDADLEAN